MPRIAQNLTKQHAATKRAQAERQAEQAAADAAQDAAMRAIRDAVADKFGRDPGNLEVHVCRRGRRIAIK